MKQLIEQRGLVRKNFLALIGISLCFYFTYHLIQGERSYLRLLTIDTEKAKLEKELAALTTEREAIERKVVMMRPDTLDKDLAEEQARKVLGYVREGEYIQLEKAE